MSRRILLSLYPRAWRERYELELLALLEDAGLGARTALGLFRGAVDAHLRPSASLRGTPQGRLRGTLAAAAACGTLFALAGAAWAKTIEDPIFIRVGDVHPALAVARDVIMVLAVLAAGAGVLAGAPIVRADPRLLIRPALGVGGFAAATALLLVLHAHGGAVAALWNAATLAAACVVAQGLRRCGLEGRLSLAQLRRGAYAAAVLAGCLAAMSGAAAVYLAGLLAWEPAAAGSGGNAPFGLSTALMLALCCAAMLALAAPTALTASRGLRAAREIGRPAAGDC